MKITSNKRFTIDSFPEAVRPWIAALTGPLNSFLEQAIQALNAGLTLGDNLKCQKLTITVGVSQTYPIRQAYSLNERPYSVSIASIRESTGAVPTAAYSLYWQYIGGNIEVTMIGLDATKSYTVNLVAQV